jgi:hypothetical protein
MDPLTAAMQAFNAFNNFLCTPAGQKMALDQEQIFTQLMSHFGVHLASNTTPSIIPNPTPKEVVK